MSEVRMKGLKRFSYGGRRIAPDEKFYARSERHARLLEAVRRAARVVDTAPEKKRPKDPQRVQPTLDHDGDGKAGGSTAPAPSSDLTALRAEYRDVIGKKPFPGWDAETLRAKIEAKKAGG